MKDQYFGDINDYRKYGLLRLLAGTGLAVGVCWMLTHDDGGSDGELRNYLSKPERWRKYDPELYDRLQMLQQPGVRRSVQCAPAWQLVPRATYFDQLITDGARQRDGYFRAAFETLRECQILFFDPDNGIEVQSVGRGKRGSARYIYWGELREAYGSGHSLLVYQHFPRVERAQFVPFLANCLREELRAEHVAGFATPYVAFFLVHQTGHRTLLEKVAEAVHSRWRGQIQAWPKIEPAL